MRSAFSTASSSWPSSGFTNTSGMAQVGRHADFGDADEMALQRVVMHVAARQDVAQDMAHLLADAEQADRAAFGGLDSLRIDASA